MDRATILTNLEAMFTAVTGLKAQWIDASGAWQVPDMTAQAYGRLYLTPAGVQGRDSLEWEYDSTAALGEEVTPHARGLRSLVWEVTIYSMSAQPGDDAQRYAELLRDSMRFPSIKRYLDIAELGFAGIANLRRLDARGLGRVISAAQIDINLNAEQDLEGASFGYVETFDMEGVSTDMAGTPTVIISGEVPS